MKTHILLFVTLLFPITLLGQTNRIFVESTISIAWNTTDVKNLSQYGLEHKTMFTLHDDFDGFQP